MKTIRLSLAMATAMLLHGGAWGQVETVGATAAQVKDDLLEGTERFAEGASDVTDVNMDSKSLGLLTGSGPQADLARKIDFVVVHTYTYDKPGMYKLADLDAFESRLNDGNWSCLVHTRSKQEANDVCIRKGKDNESTEFVVVSAAPRELSFIHLKGRLTIADLSNMGSLMGSATPTPPHPPLMKR